MRIHYGVAAAAVLTVLAGGAALAAGPESAYLGVGGGAVILPTEKDSTTQAQMDFDTGWAAGGTIGLRWAGGLRTEIEGLHRENDFDLTTALAPGVNVGGKVKSSSIMLNGLKDFDIGWKIVPYIGVGVGWAHLNYNALGVTGKGDGGIWQLIGGASLPITDKLEGFVDYHYFDTFQNDQPGGDDNYNGHQVMAGIRWTFWEAPKPVVAAPAPAPVAQPKDYVIYFEFDKANITKAAGAVLDELKATSGGSSVSVVGHTDTMGSAAYNQKLSEKRANNTAKALDTRGVKIDGVTGKGFSEPAVNTGPGVKEPLNRRAVIKLNSAGATQ